MFGDPAHHVLTAETKNRADLDVVGAHSEGRSPNAPPFSILRSAGPGGGLGRYRQALVDPAWAMAFRAMTGSLVTNPTSMS